MGGKRRQGGKERREVLVAAVCHLWEVPFFGLSDRCLSYVYLLPKTIKDRLTCGKGGGACTCANGLDRLFSSLPPSLHVCLPHKGTEPGWLADGQFAAVEGLRSMRGGGEREITRNTKRKRERKRERD